MWLARLARGPLSENHSLGDAGQPFSTLKMEDQDLLLDQLRHAPVDLIIHSGSVINPAKADKVLNDVDVVIAQGRIVALAKTTPEQRAAAKELYDASGKLVTPGLIDLHAHVYQHATPLGIDPDTYCLSRGVTTVLDAGSSGASTFQGLRKFIAEPSKTRVLSFIHITMHGLASTGCVGFGKGGELDSLNQVNEEWASKCIEENKDMVVGVKIRLAADCADNGKNEREAFRRARAVATKLHVPLMLHHAFSSIPHEGDDGALGGLSSGDIYTHMLHGYPSSIIEVAENGTEWPNGSIYRVRDAAKEARARGVLFDVGHGMGSFSWRVAEVCCQNNFFPDTISTDLHTESCGSPCYDLTTSMSKMLALGMDVYEVVRAVTSTPASAIGWEDRIGALSPGFVADVTVLDVQTLPDGTMVEDCQGQLREMSKLIRAVAVWKDGARAPITYTKFPDYSQDNGVMALWERLIVRDEIPPASFQATSDNTNPPPTKKAKH